MLLLQPGAFRGRDGGGQRRALRGQPGRGQPGLGPPAPPGGIEAPRHGADPPAAGAVPARLRAPTPRAFVAAVGCFSRPIPAWSGWGRGRGLEIGAGLGQDRRGGEGLFPAAMGEGVRTEGSPKGTARPPHLLNVGLPHGPAWATALGEEGMALQKGKTQCSHPRAIPTSFSHGQQHSHLFLREEVLFPPPTTAPTPPSRFTATLPPP